MAVPMSIDDVTVVADRAGEVRRALRLGEPQAREAELLDPAGNGGGVLEAKAGGVGVELHAQYDFRPRSRAIALRWIWLVPPEMVATIDSRHR